MKEKTIVDLVNKLLAEGAKTVFESVVPGGPIIGKIGSTIIGALSVTVLGDFGNRILSRRELLKTGSYAALSLSKIKNRLDQGHHLRTDDHFFANNENYRSDAEEVFEGVLLKAKNEHEEKKIPYISSIFANAAFVEVSLSELNHILSISDTLTFTQLRLLAWLEQTEHKNRIDTSKTGMENRRELSIFHQAVVLAQNGLIVFRGEREGDGKEYVASIVDVTDVDFNYIDLTGFGKKVFDLLSLNEVPEREIEDVLDMIQMRKRG